MTAPPPLLPPEGIGRTEAAAFCGLSLNSFNVAVKDGRLPQPIRFGKKNGRYIWTVTGLRSALCKEGDLTEKLPAERNWGDVGKDALRG